MSGDHHSPEEVKKHVGLYLKVGAALGVLTAVTVGVGFLHIPSVALAVIIGMAIASVKGGLVAAIYMHLMGEKKIIFWTLGLTVVFFIVAMSLPVLTDLDSVGTKVAPYVKVNSAHAHHDGHGDAHGEGHADEHGAADAHAEESHDAEHSESAPAVDEHTADEPAEAH